MAQYFLMVDFEFGKGLFKKYVIWVKSCFYDDLYKNLKMYRFLDLTLRLTLIFDFHRLNQSVIRKLFSFTMFY